MGQCEYELKSLADDQLLSGLARVVGRRNQITAEFLAYLAELDERQLFLDLGYSSLFEYCVEKLRLCESTAGRHIAAARVCRHHPEAFAMVASGMLHASALSLLRKHLTQDNAKELFELCSERSTRKVEELLAARFPRPDVRDLVRRLPTRTRATLDAGCAAEPSGVTDPSRDLLAGREGASVGSPLFFHAAMTAPNECPRTLPAPASDPLSDEIGSIPVEAPSRSPSAEPAVGHSEVQSHRPSGSSGLAAQKSRRIEPLSADRFGVHFTADGEFCALLERVRGLAGHRLPGGDLMTLLKRGLEAYGRELEKERFAVGRKARRCVQVEPRGHEQHFEVGTRPDALTPEVLAGDAPAAGRAAPGPTSKSISNRRRRRHCPAEVARAVFARDGKQCSYVSPDGRRCGARRRLEFDHIVPFSEGGEDTIQNLRLRCQAHNQHYARQYFGSARVYAALQRARRRRAARIRDSVSDESRSRTVREIGDESHLVEVP